MEEITGKRFQDVVAEEIPSVDRQRQLDYAVLSNTSAGAWPIARAIDDVLGKEE